MFALHSVYLKPIEEVDRYLEAHRTFLKELYAQGITICSGPQVPRTGGFILLNAADRQEAETIIAGDPYVVNGVAKYAIIEFEVRSCAEEFRQFIREDKMTGPLRILLLLLLTPLFSMAQGTWERVPVPASVTLTSVFFTDSLYGWIAGDSGVILHTVDGGANWAAQQANTVNDIQEIFFLDRNLGWASSFNFSSLPYGTVLLKTTNGGATWSSQPYPDNNIFINCILFRDPLNGWMGGSPHALVRTTDGGVTWTQAAIDTSTLAFFPVLSIKFYNDQYGYASGGRFDIAGVTWHTSDGGNLWYAINPLQAPADEVHELHIFDSLHVMGAGGDPDFGYGVGMIRTFDGGFNWEYEELTVQGNAYDLDFRNDHEAWAPLGPRRKLIYSLDTGNTWAPVVTPDSTAIFKITFPDSLHGWAVGKEGAVLKYHPPVVPAVPSENPLPGTILLEPVHPNPVSGMVNFIVVLPGTGLPEFRNPEIKIFSLTGQEIASIPVRNTAPGRHLIEFDSSALPAGIYFYCLRTDDTGNPGTLHRCLKMLVGN